MVYILYVDSDNKTTNKTKYLVIRFDFHAKYVQSRMSTRRVGRFPLFFFSRDVFD